LKCEKPLIEGLSAEKEVLSSYRFKPMNSIVYKKIFFRVPMRVPTGLRTFKVLITNISFISFECPYRGIYDLRFQ
jgi:hypothetical protein